MRTLERVKERSANPFQEGNRLRKGAGSAGVVASERTGDCIPLVYCVFSIGYQRVTVSRWGCRYGFQCRGGGGGPTKRGGAHNERWVRTDRISTK